MLSPLTPSRAARLLLLAAHNAGTLRSLGDVPGHDFHGNQYTVGYHGTTEDHVASIKAKGLLPDSNNLSFVVSDKKIAEEYARRQARVQFRKTQKEVAPVVVEVHVPTSHAYDKLSSQAEGAPTHKIEGGVPKEWIRGIHHLKTLAAVPVSPIHHAADAHVAKFSVAIRYAFAMARKKVGTGKPNVEPVITALRTALEDVLPATLLKVVAAGGVAGVALLLGQLRTAGDVEGHAFHGNQWTHGSALAGGNTLELTERGDTTHVHVRFKSGSASSMGRVEKKGSEYHAKGEDVHISTHGTKHEAVRAVIERNGFKALGDVEGHAFHGNQWTSGGAPVSVESGAIRSPKFNKALDFVAKSYPELLGPHVSITLVPKGSRTVRGAKTNGTTVRNIKVENGKPVRDAQGVLQHTGKYTISISDKRATTQDYVATLVHELEHVRQWGVGTKPDEMSAAFAGHAAGRKFSGLAAAEIETITALAGPLRMQFDAQNPAVIEWARKHAAELVTQVTDTTRERIRLAVEELQAEGDWEFAHDRIAAAVGDQDRADLIARHETMLAAGEGQRQAWAQAEDEGLLTGDEQRGWIVTPDEKLCPICEGLEDKVADLDGVYVSDDGDEYDGPPAHVLCRCSEGIVALRGAASFDEAEHPRDGNGQWASGAGTSVEHVRQALANAPAGHGLIIGGETYKAMAGGNWATSAGHTLTAADMTNHLSTMVDAGLVPGTTLTPTQQTELAAALAAKVKKKSKLPMTVFTIAAASDWSATGWNLTHGGAEGNPMINWLKTPPKIIAAGAGMDVVGAWGWARMTKDHQKIQAVGFYAATAFRGYLVLRNIQYIKRQGHGQGVVPFRGSI